MPIIRNGEVCRTLAEVIDPHGLEFRAGDMKIKIQGGTTSAEGPGLCHTCKHATVVVGDNLKQELVHCDELYGDSKFIRFRVRSCSKYLHKNHMSVREMEQMAWILKTDPKKNQIGFVPHKDLEDGDRDKFVLTHRYDE